MRRGNWKLIHYRSPEEARERGHEFELYDLEQDPNETMNLKESRPEVVAELRLVLDQWIRTSPLFGEQGVEINVEDLDEQTLEMLKALGYIGVGRGRKPERAGTKPDSPATRVKSAKPNY